MARCFPFPPPGYTKCSSYNNEALILSIKLQEEKEKSNLDKEKDIIKSSSDRKKDRKKEKKEKKEKKKEKKEKKEKKKEERRANEKQKLIDELHQADKPGVVPKDKLSLLGNEVEQLERSNLTEEHGRPSLQNGSSSTDSTGNSCKRKRPPVPPNGIQSNGNIIRICLSSSHKREEPSTSGSKEQEISLPLHRRADHHAASIMKVQPCSNTLRMEPLRTEPSRAEPSIVKMDATVVKAPLNSSHIPSTSVAGTTQPDKTVKEKKHVSSREKKLRKKQSKYTKLFDSWVPMSLDSGLLVGNEGDDSDDWLFGTAKRVKTSEVQTSSRGGDNNNSNLPSCGSFALQPRSQFLPDVDIYALPFTVPF